MFLCEVNRNHHHVSLRYFGHLRLTRQQEGSPPVTLSGLFFGNAFIQLFTELSWVIEALRCHDISPLKSPAIERGDCFLKTYVDY
ncbi:hypothetical protein [Proteus sp. G2665]|uniref:hypothetical protein n=1 Tax=Proteus sp. G2665 TaxID=2698878 RepID=UPI0013766DB4|nr:hypothetical protein [Proteus sp. G2665]NBN03318.1 hypothetical protein [Proteus sp. G2665]